jgi:hypothetical protein
MPAARLEGKSQGNLRPFEGGLMFYVAECNRRLLAVPWIRVLLKHLCG